MVDTNKSPVDQELALGSIDPEWYLNEYQDVRILGMDPVKHFLWLGKLLNRKPNPNYVLDGPCLPRGGNIQINKTTRDIFTPPNNIYKTVTDSIYFDKEWYSRKYASVLNGEDPASHYLRIGAPLGLDPSPLFSTSQYLKNYSDVQSAGWNPLYHFIVHGLKEGRKPKEDQNNSKLPLVRFTPREKGTPHNILQFDLPTNIDNPVKKEKIAIHVHLYHTEMADDILYYLRNVKHEYTLLISLKSGEDLTFWQGYFKERLPAAKDVMAKKVPNRGRDVAPWLVDFKEEVKNSTFFCHLHTKKSVHNKHCNAGWFRYLSHTILGSDSVVDQILCLLSSDAGVGLVGPCYFWALSNQPNYGTNREWIEKLYRHLTHYPLPDECPDFPAGSFFWARTEILQPLFELNLTSIDFPDERGQIDGTIAHAIERLLGLLPALSGMRYHMVTVDVAYDLTRYMHPERKVLSRSLQHHKSTRTKTSKNSKIAVFSCLSGGYEETMPLLTNYEDVDCFLFCDSDNVIPPTGFSLVKCNYNNPANVRTARFVKTHPHVWFSDYDYAIWIDSNIHFFGDIHDYIKALDSSNTDCGFIYHPARSSVYEEYKELIEEKLVEPQVAQNQIERYLNYPETANQPLLETNFFICRPKSDEVAKFFKLWWSEINRYCHRDQISIGYAIQQTNLKWTALLEPGRSVREHPDFVLFKHDYKNRKAVIEFLQGKANDN